MGKVIAVCISEKKGTQKTSVHEAQFIKDWGIEGDAHAGKWHRQVSLLSAEKIQAFKDRGADIHDGAFGENLVISGFDFSSLPVGTVFQCNDVILRMTQIGKECPEKGSFVKSLMAARSGKEIHFPLRRYNNK